MGILWTGFEAFGKHETNPSWDAATAADECLSDRVSTRAERLPVSYGGVDGWTEEQFGDEEELLVVQFGLAESREVISLERTGRNAAGSRADETGQVGPDRLLDGEKVAQLQTSMDLPRLRDALGARLEGEGLPAVKISDDAGSYVCNALYFLSLHRCAEADTVLFVHIPWMSARRAAVLGRCFAEELPRLSAVS